MNLLEKAMKKLTEAKEIEVNEEDIITNPDNVEEIEETNEAKEIEVNEEDIITDPENVDEVEESKGTYLEVLESDLKEMGKEASVEELTESVDWGYFNKFKEIDDKYMPDSGEGETLASQVVTAINKLIYKWYNDGDVYDNVNSSMIGWANDLSSYANWLNKYCKPASRILDSIYGCSSDDEYEGILKALADKCLSEEYLETIKDEPKQGTIYDCDGPFEFKEDNGEDDEEYDMYESKENHGNKTTELNDNDPALKKPYESETVRDISKEMKALKNEDKEIEEAKEDKYKKYLDAAKERMGRDLTSEEISLLKAFVDIEEMEMEAEPKTEDLLKETGEWDEEDDEMASWKEDLKEQSKELASRINGEVKSVIGIDKYQGPEAVISTPNYGDITLMYDPEDDTGRSFVAKVAYLGFITGDINHLAELLNSNDIPEDEVIVENVNKASFNVMLTKFIKENYKNAKNLRINKVTKVTEGYNIEASLKLKNEQVVPVTFLAKGTITEGKTSILKIYENKVFKNMDENKNIMTMIVSNNGSLKLEKLKYNFNTKLTENKKANVYGIIK